MYKEKTDQKFVEMYLELITTNVDDKLKKLQMIKEFYNYATKGVGLGNNYRISIKSRNIESSKNLEKEFQVKKLVLNNKDD